MAELTPMMQQYMETKKKYRVEVKNEGINGRNDTNDDKIYGNQKGVP